MLWCSNQKMHPLPEVPALSDVTGSWESPCLSSFIGIGFGGECSLSSRWKNHGTTLIAGHSPKYPSTFTQRILEPGASAPPPILRVSLVARKQQSLPGGPPLQTRFQGNVGDEAGCSVVAPKRGAALPSPPSLQEGPLLEPSLSKPLSHFLQGLSHSTFLFAFTLELPSDLCFLPHPH
ncbi:hypothetical protein HJG60_009500 [Phyllostomus discolor]|uniref:Uncharacterized protein n=1 Tax=Phyllostomus discolor TaxID=89673 RepID=A0A833YC26_9CHIR|nr:hypothetical protein HJG60_009500 [Phyllostomus discolor]